MSLLIINNHDSFTFNLVDYIRRLNVPFQVVNVEELDLDAVDDFSHLLISPARMCRALIRNYLSCWRGISIVNPFWACV